jgi:Tol biopolymer transport system component
VIDVDGDNKIQITDGDGDTNHHAWSPDGTRLAYQSDRNGNVDIYSFDLRDNQEYRVTDSEGRDVGPTWDCSGINLSYTAEQDDSSDIYRVFWKGGASSFLTNHPAVDQWSEWSPAKETASRDE